MKNSIKHLSKLTEAEFEKAMCEGEIKQVSFASVVFADESLSRKEKIEFLTMCETLPKESDRAEAESYLNALKASAVSEANKEIEFVRGLR